MCNRQQHVETHTQSLYEHGFSATRAVHGAGEADPHTGAVLTPICQSTTYAHAAVGEHRGHTYSRASNPTVSAAERAIGSLEDAPPAVCFSTGMAAISALFLSLLRSGDHAVISDVVYGGTMRLADQILAGLGIAVTYADTTRAQEVARAITPATRLVFIETPANPTLVLTDIAAVAHLCHERGVPLAVDNTFLTPFIQRPLDLGATVSLASTTKYIEGHNATLGGAITTRDQALDARLRLVRKTLGFIQSPFEAWLTIRGIKTLGLRMRRQCESAARIAGFLSAHPDITRVCYPGLANNPQHDLARRQHIGGLHGGIVSFEVRGGALAGLRVMNALTLCTRAENLGAAETLVTHPATMTHADVPQDIRERAGLTDGLIRLSVGLEEPDDIIDDLARALPSSERRAPRTLVAL
ncbi:MAG: aminotransferase class I/II-fold pyridoxal phosphate-dependent enzyme [Phycisphaeraceae bacterium]|nr:aminotransferase class I/II-fold pyridoxal phosphate-dependent enzyme [Phycisphaeraceae bacterium]